MWRNIIDSILELIQNMGNISNWLFTPMFTSYADLPLGFMLLEKLGVDITWVYNLYPAYIILGGLVFFLGAVLIFKLISTFWPFS